MKFIKSNDRISKFNTSFETVAYLRTKQNLSLYPNSNQHFERPAGIVFSSEVVTVASCFEDLIVLNPMTQSICDSRVVVNELSHIKNFDSYSFLLLICVHSLFDELFASFPFKCSFLYNSFSTV